MTTNPTIFAEGARRRATPTTTRSRDLAQRKVSVDEAVRALTDVRRPLGLRRAAARLRRDRTASTAGCRSRSTRGWPTTPRRPSPRPARCGGSSTGPTCSSRSPRPSRACRRSRRSLVGGHQRQRHADLRHRALPRRSWTRSSTGWSRRKANGHDLSTIDSVASFFVCRVDTEIDARLDKIGTDEAAGAARRRPAIANARLAYERVRGGLRLRPLEGARRRRGQPAAPAVGVDRRQGPGLRRHALRRRAGRPRDRQHDARGDARRGRRPRRGPRRHGAAAPTRPRRRSIDALGCRRRSTYDDVIEVLEVEGVEKFEASWESMLATVKDQLAATAPKQA